MSHPLSPTISALLLFFLLLYATTQPVVSQPNSNPTAYAFKTNESILRVPLGQFKGIVLPTLAPSDQFILRIAPAIPTPSPSPIPSPIPSPDPGSPPAKPPAPSQVISSAEPRPETTLIIDVISPRQHRLIVTAALQTPAPCLLRFNPQTNSDDSADLPPDYCVRPQTDTLAYAIRSSRAFVYVSALASETAVILSVTNDESISLSDIKVHISRILHRQPNSDAICPGSALEGRCSNIGSCNAQTSRCECPIDFGDIACHVQIRTLGPPQREPPWNGIVAPLANSTLVNVTLNGLVSRIRQPGSPSRISVRARVLIGAIETNGIGVSVDNGDALLSMMCKVRGDNAGTGLEDGTDVPTVYDTDARAQVVRHPLSAGGAIFDLVCVSASDIGPEDDWLVAFVAQTLVANTSAALTSVLSVRVLRCGSRDLPECPLGVRAGTVSLAAWVGIGIGVVIGIILLVACIFWACRTTIKGLPGRQGGILDGRLYQVVDYGKSPEPPQANNRYSRSHSRHSHPRPNVLPEPHPPIDKVHPVPKRSVVEETSSQEERVYPRIMIKRKSQDVPHQQRLVDWDAVWQLERERRRVQYDDDGYQSGSVETTTTAFRINTTSAAGADIRENLRESTHEYHDIREVRDPRDLRDLRDQRDLQDWRDLRDLRDQREQRSDMRTHREIREQFEHRSQHEIRDQFEQQSQQELRDIFERRSDNHSHNNRTRTSNHYNSNNNNSNNNNYRRSAPLNYQGDPRNELDLREQQPESQDQRELREMRERLERRSRRNQRESRNYDHERSHDQGHEHHREYRDPHQQRSSRDRRERR